MTRGYVFTLVDPNIAYNLWKDLILPTITDPTMANSPFVSNIVCDLQIYFPIAGPNSTNNPGNNFGVFDPITGFEMSNQISDGLFHVSSQRNIFPLTNFSLKGSAANVKVEVTIASF